MPKFIIKSIHFNNDGVSLRSFMIFIFSALSLLPLIGILLYSYQQNKLSIIESLNQQVARDIADTENVVFEGIKSIVNRMNIIANTASTDPLIFRRSNSEDILFSTLKESKHVDAFYTSFEDGYHRVVTRIDQTRRESDPNIPSKANWHSSYIDSYSAGTKRARHRTFSEVWGKKIGPVRSSPTETDIRLLPHYSEAKATGRLAGGGRITTNPDTGNTPIMSLAVPIISNNEFIGIVGANMTFSNVSNYLEENQLNPEDIYILYNDDNQILASSEKDIINKIDSNKSGEILELDDLNDPLISKIVKLRDKAQGKPYLLEDSSGREIILVSRRLEIYRGFNWHILIITYTENFVGDLERTNLTIAKIILCIILFSLFFIIIFSNFLSKNIRSIVNQFDEIGKFNLDYALPAKVGVREITEISKSVETMKVSLRSFGRYVPKDLVRRLLADGDEAQLGGSRRQLSLFFSDVADFTSISESLTPEVLVDAMREHFEAITQAIVSEGGTVDKFMGDSVMAMFNAPGDCPDHPVRACKSALYAQHRLSTLTEGGHVLRARIGLGFGEVLVGNFGTRDRFAFTALGDAVNLASRIEGLNKLYGTSIIASGELREATGSTFEWRLLDRVSVKGRQQVTSIYELLGFRNEVGAELLLARDAYEKALNQYFNGSFSEAILNFKIAENLREDDLATLALIGRSEAYLLSPPPDDWNGVEVMRSK